MNQISLDDMRLFVAVAQAGSLTAASDLTGVPISRLSRRLTELEQSLGTKLINRGKKGISLNEPGERFFSHAQSMTLHADLAIGSIQESLAQPAGVLKISLPIDIGTILAPHFRHYLKQYPKVSLDITLSQQKINMIQDGVDVAIRAGTINNDNVVAKMLFTLSSGIYAHRDYLAKHGTPATPDELHHHRTITQSLALPWQFTQGDRFMSISPTAHISGNDFMLIKHFIEQGLGVGMLPTIVAQDSNLVRILDDWQIPLSPLSAIYYKNRGAVPTVKSFIDWLMDYVKYL